MCIVEELAGEGSVAVAVSVGNRWHVSTRGFVVIHSFTKQLLKSSSSSAVFRAPLSLSGKR